MLNFQIKGNYQDATGYNWVFYGDDQNPNLFYILPKPQYALDAGGKPILQLTRYLTDDSSNGSGFVSLQVALAVPQDVQQAILGQIQQQFHPPGPITLSPLQYNPGATASLKLTSEGQDLNLTVPASQFGSNTATFVLQLAKQQLDTVVATLSSHESDLNVTYQFTVPSRLPAVTAVLTFDSALAYQYQVTQPAHHTWGEDTPGSVQKALQESQSSHVTITWGIANPDDTLVQAVADWANNTLATLVQAQVQKTMQILGLQSGDSFSINQVSSFTATYSENQVVDWHLNPQSTLPSLNSLGLNVQDFLAEVNQRQQVITVHAQLPFTQDSQNSTGLPAGDLQAALLESVVVTARYPGLSEEKSTITFTENGAHTFTAPYDPQQGPSYQLEYRATYQQSSASVQSTIDGLDQGDYYLKLNDVGYLNVTFDAAQAFNIKTTTPLKSVDVILTFVDSDGTGTPIHQTLHLTPESPRGIMGSPHPMPINSGYNYTVTYTYDDLVYTAPTQVNQTGFTQLIYPAAGIHTTNLIISVPANADPIFDATVQMWFTAAPTVPGIAEQPTQDAPAVFQLTPEADSTGASFVRATFEGFINGHAPLGYSAAIDSVDGQILINDQLIEPTQASVMVTPTQRYYTLEVNSDAISWTTATYDSVEVLITTTVNGKAQPQRLVKWNRTEGGSQYLTYSIQDGNAVTYAYEVRYITPGQGVQKVTGSGETDVVFNIPATPSSPVSAD
ncbi:hypothetical protein [Deinococcus cellulosilyticus]|uniref:Uncharacterized protein n=1 Tax=Deinococcus cellulosilyticus (strain DSM 18568 / NBRC 106333 / KACC 11606 / 5516J-15) TaxID=1223518 RepID=A0A511MZI0_DEIC1|nr:hypothetical protein [Deinococcus cellulosilyticus]GEM45668.1 hypothetical protein DC3_13030 [Deinococcus cellulosilyticus NBRC 106333 = KACC 11606]